MSNTQTGLFVTVFKFKYKLWKNKYCFIENKIIRSTTNLSLNQLFKNILKLNTYYHRLLHTSYFIIVTF